MALINCPECSREISDQVAVCPQCGFRRKGSSGAARIGYGILGLVGVFVVLAAIGDRMDTPERRAQAFKEDRAACGAALSESMQHSVANYGDCLAWAQRAETACRNIAISGKPVTVNSLCGPTSR